MLRIAFYPIKFKLFPTSLRSVAPEYHIHRSGRTALVTALAARFLSFPPLKNYLATKSLLFRIPKNYLLVIGTIQALYLYACVKKAAALRRVTTVYGRLFLQMSSIYRSRLNSAVSSFLQIKLSNLHITVAPQCDSPFVLSDQII